MAEADSGPFMTSGPAPMGHLWRSHCPLGSPNSQSRGRSEDTYGFGDGHLLQVGRHDLLIAHVPSGGRSPPTIAARPLCPVPRQDDFPRGNVPTGKDALRSIHWKLDDRPISMKLYEFAAIDGPEQTSA